MNRNRVNRSLQPYYILFYKKWQWSKTILMFGRFLLRKPHSDEGKTLTSKLDEFCLHLNPAVNSNLHFAKISKKLLILIWPCGIILSVTGYGVAW